MVGRAITLPFEKLKMGYFDLEDNFGYYGAFHSHPVNILIHSLFVWPNVFTTLVMLYFTPALFSIKVTSPEFEILEPALIFNLGLLFTVGHGIYYMMLDKRSGTLGALILAVFWVAACHLGRALGFYLAWKVKIWSPIFISFHLLTLLTVTNIHPGGASMPILLLRYTVLESWCH